MKRLLGVGRILLLCFLSVMVWGHGGERHEAEELKNPGEIDLEILRSEYRNKIEPIFHQKCFDCHSQLTVYPWYYKVPLVKQLIDSDIAEGLKHIDMTAGLPFKGHGSVEKDMEAIHKTIEKNSMPPWRYRIMHPENSLSEKEKILIIQWIKSIY